MIKKHLHAFCWNLNAFQEPIRCISSSGSWKQSLNLSLTAPFLNDVGISHVWKLFKKGMLGDSFYVVDRFIWVYGTIKPEVVNLLEIGCRFCFVYFHLFSFKICFNRFGLQIVPFVNHAIKPLSSNMSSIETVSNELNCFFLIKFQVPFEFR